MKHSKIDTFNASKEELIAEIKRMDAVIERWSSGWTDMVAANTKVWQQQYEDLRDRQNYIQRLATRFTDKDRLAPLTSGQAQGYRNAGNTVLAALALPIEAIRTNSAKLV